MCQISNFPFVNIDSQYSLVRKIRIKMDTVPPKPKKIKSATREELLNLSKDDLVDKVLQLEAHNSQLKNIIAKSLSGDEETERKRKKPFDFSKCQYRRVLLRILYFGWDYQGLAVQEDTTQTVEHHLFHALTKSCLIQNRETSQYHRCGRTDKGVSAFGQVISISLRSNHGESGDVSKEMPYCKILNRLLPKEIRAIAWMPIPTDKPEYSARFDCTQRQYKYYFPRGSLRLSAMRDACSRLPGSHDFRHLCKMDVGNGVTQFTREVRRAEILSVLEEGDNPYTMYYLLIEGNAFLWHQIRCIMGLLLLVGQGVESSDIITELLDIDNNPRKPQYSMALDVPLNLFHCSYDLEQTQKWIYDKDELKTVITQLQGEWTIHNINWYLEQSQKWSYDKDELKTVISMLQGEWIIHNIKATMIRDALQHLEKEYDLNKSETDISDSTEKDRITAHADCLLQGVKPKVYKPLLERQTCSSLEERIEYYKKKRKLPASVETQSDF